MAETPAHLFHHSLGSGEGAVLRGPRVTAFTSPDKPFESLQTCKNKMPGWLRGTRQEGASLPGVSRELERSLGDAVGRAGPARSAGSAVWAGWVGPARARGSGARGSPPAAPGRRADGVSKVTLRTPTVSGGGGNTYEPFGLLPGRAPGERQPLGASGFRRLVPGRAESSPLGRRAWGLLRNRSCLKCETIPRTQGSVTSVSLP